MKRGMDVMFALVWLVLTAPLMVLVALLIKLESRALFYIRHPWSDKMAKCFLCFDFVQCSQTQLIAAPNKG